MGGLRDRVQGGQGRGEPPLEPRQEVKYAAQTGQDAAQNQWREVPGDDAAEAGDDTREQQKMTDDGVKAGHGVPPVGSKGRRSMSERYAGAASHTLLKSQLRLAKVTASVRA